MADRLAAARRGRFVGRMDLIALFRSALLAAEPPFAVLYLHGPGGVGKTTLLREFSRIAAEAGRTALYLDGRNSDPSPAAFLGAVRQALGSEDLSPPDWPADVVLFLDTYEQLAPLDAWLRDTFLPSLPAHSLTVLAGRNPPAVAWRTDLDWAALTRILPLGNLQPEESRTYLAARGIPEDRHAEVLAFTRGHPLALTLVADVLNRGDSLTTFSPASEPEVVRVLLERLVQDVPSATHRQALRVCVLAWATTEALLAEVLGVDHAQDLFAWLRQLSFVEQGPHGLFPHDLARDVLDADLRWRDPASHRHLVQSLATSLHARLDRVHGAQQQRLWLDILHLNRHNPSVRPYFEWSALSSVYAEPALPQDHSAILAMTCRHQGEAAAAIARYWLGRQPQAFLVYRDVQGDVVGFMAELAIHDAVPDDLAADPAVAVALEFAQRHGPVQPGEEILYLRFWMHREAYQDVSPATTLTAINCSIHWTTRPRLAWNFVAIAAPEVLAPLFASIHMWRSAEADFTVGGRHYGVFAHDWRVEPAGAWLRVNQDLALITDAGLGQGAAAPAPRAAALSAAEFADAVRQALRDYTRPDLLATNPLLRSSLGAAVAGQEPAATLRACLREAVATLAANPKDAKFHRALWHTYIEPAPTQEQAAELLDLPFNTYRYHLAKGVERVADALWRRERDTAAR